MIRSRWLCAKLTIWPITSSLARLRNHTSRAVKNHTASVSFTPQGAGRRGRQLTSRARAGCSSVCTPRRSPPHQATPQGYIPAIVIISFEIGVIAARRYERTSRSRIFSILEGAKVRQNAICSHTRYAELLTSCHKLSRCVDVVIMDLVTSLSQNRILDRDVNTTRHQQALFGPRHCNLQIINEKLLLKKMGNLYDGLQRSKCHEASKIENRQATHAR